jgi:hypothetical protein
MLLETRIIRIRNRAPLNTNLTKLKLSEIEIDMVVERPLNVILKLK